MAIFDGIKAAFDRGGIGLKLEIPNKFSWGDPTIPATITLTGHKREPRLVHLLEFAFVNYVKTNNDSSSQDTSGNIINILHEDPTEISLSPGETVTLTVDVPAFEDISAVNAAIDQALDESGAPKLVNKLAKFAFKTNLRPEDVREFQLTVAAHVDGVKHPKKATRRILNQASMGWKSRTTIAGFDIT